ncbi:putative ABC transporter ATP-binding protein YxlF [Streptomyces netropsis]|uniref:ABC-type multidrug transport system ATPase subunit n=1 Tax=Streptomyces syringium TaxID=76729 RepID=A0ABS4Y9U7_9ACTN|nr:ATP-binding cassette domain-containing protein [Streptomyces syringium]MBP2405581.1 ABC-type multidrug transport system ATPase subunit [Streptomyces syringium]SPE64493.1 putative ABC transporter ATP-binding protein YxlF [Streptomyces netropsis]
MIQAIGLTSAPRRNHPPAVDDLTFEARPGRVTVLLGEPGAGKTSALRLMLRLDPGRGVALFRGRTLDRVAHPTREIGVLLGDVPGHPARTARGHLRMLSAAAGVPAERADDVLEVVGLSGLADQRIGDFSLGMDRRLGLAAALLGDPHTLLLDEPAEGLSPRETAWLHGMLRGYAAQGGAVLVTSGDPREAARIGDRVVTVERGRLVADQEAAAFARTRLRPRVVVHSPFASRLAHVLTVEADVVRASPDGPPVEVTHEGGSRIHVYGSSCAAVGETAYRHGILVHRLADETGDTGPVSPLHRADGRRPDTTDPAAAAEPEAEPGTAPAVEAATGTGPPPRPVPTSRSQARLQPRLPAPGPVWPLLYELRRATGVRTGWITGAVSLAASLVTSVLLARTSGTPALRLLTGWPALLPLPPAAFGAGLLGALAFGQEFRYPALAPDQGTVPRRLGLLAAKLAVTAMAALLLAFASLGLDAAALRLLFGDPAVVLPDDWALTLVGWAGLTLGCAWAGLLAAGVFRSTALGLVAVLAVPTLVMPVLGGVLTHPTARSLIGLPGRLRATALVQWPSGVDQALSAALRLMSQPVGWALALSFAVLLGAYVLTVFRGRPR